MSGIELIDKSEAEALLDVQGVQAASLLLDNLSAPAQAIPDQQATRRTNAILERLVLPSDARNILDHPLDINREFDWAAYGREYVRKAAKIRKMSSFYADHLRILSLGHEDWQGDLFEDTIHDLNCNESEVFASERYPYLVALGEITVKTSL